MNICSHTYALLAYPMRSQYASLSLSRLLQFRPDGSLVSSLYTSGKLDEHMFSMCLLDSGGLFVLGGMEPRLHSAPIQWTPLQTTRQFYTVSLESVTIGEQTFSHAYAIPVQEPIPIELPVVVQNI